jgi:tetratricopeptide (TPR) repeat protein
VSRYNLAIDIYKKVIRYRPDDKDALDNISLLYIIIGQTKEAIQYINQLSTLDIGMSNELEILVRRTAK